jgi:hypothetical protein
LSADEERALSWRPDGKAHAEQTLTIVQSYAKKQLASLPELPADA